MKDEDKTKEQLLEELKVLRKQAAELKESKGMDEALRESEERFRKVFEDAPIGMAIVGLDYRLIKVNKILYEMLGYSEQELTALTFVDITHPEDIAKDVRLAEQVFKGGITSYKIEKRFIKKSGDILWGNLTATVIRGQDGKVLYGLGMVEDITERKWVAEKLRRQNEYLAALHETALALMNRLELENLLEAIVTRAGALVGTPHGFIYLIEPGEAEMVMKVGVGIYSKLIGFRIKPGEGMAGKVWQSGEPLAVEDYQTWLDRLPVPYLDIFRSVVGIPLKSGSQVMGVLGLAYVEGGRTFAEDEIGLLSRFAELASIALDNAWLYTSLQQELVERKRAEEQLKVVLTEKEILLKEIHHRVKNNLQIVCSLLDLQSDHAQSPQALELLKESQNRIRSMALIHERLYRSPSLAKIDFTEYIQDLTAYLFHSYEGHLSPITLRMNVEDISLGIDMAIPCGLILNELVSNSLKHAFPEGKGELSIELCSSESDKFTLVVSDNGVGFPKDLDFRNTESLGLQLVTSLTDQLKGTIELDRSRGTTFKMTFAKVK